MRNAKEGNIRKDELLNIALMLFNEKGYQNTTIEDILNRSEISKGTFYYYFESKEEVLKVLAWREAEKKIELTRRIVEDCCLSAIDKINKIISEALKINFIDIENRILIYQMVDEYANLQFRQRLFENSVQLGTPLIQRIFEQGVAEKTMKIDDPEEVARFYIEMMNCYKIAAAKMQLQKQDKYEIKRVLKKKTQFYQSVFEKVLGVETGLLLFSTITFQYLDQLK
jgi:AcrR family transcriptional regulator